MGVAVGVLSLGQAIVYEDTDPLAVPPQPDLDHARVPWAVENLRTKWKYHLVLLSKNALVEKRLLVLEIQVC